MTQRTFEPFANRVATSVVPVQQRDPAAQRSGLAEGLRELGGAVDHAADVDAQVKGQLAASEARIAEQERRRALSAAVADRAGAWADVQVGLSSELDDLRTKAAPAEYAKKADALITTRLKGFLDPLNPDATPGADAELYERFAPMVASFGAQTRMSEDDWARKQGALAQGSAIDKWRGVVGNGLLGKPTPDGLVNAIDATENVIGAMDLPPAARDKAIGDTKRGFVLNYFDGLLNVGNWQGAKNLVDSGKFDSYFDAEGQDKARLLNKIGVASDAAVRAEATAAREAQAAAKASLDAMSAKIDGGIVPPAGELDAAEAAAKAAGVPPDDMVKFGVLRIQAQVNRQYGAMVGKPGGADRIRVARDALAQKMGAGKASESDQVVKAQLDKLLTGADTKEIEPLKELAAKGPQGVVAALGSLGGTPEAQYDKAEKIEPGLGFVSLFDPSIRSRIVNGRAILKARKGDFGKDKEAQDSARGFISAPIARTLGDNYDDVVDAAQAFMADRQAALGKTGFDDNLFQLGLRYATGATLRPGTKILQGGLQESRGRKVIVPDWMTAPEFGTAMSYTDFKGAVYGNGQPASNADVLKYYAPVYAGDDPSGNPYYTMVGGDGGVLRQKGGSPFVVRFKKGGR